VQIGRRPNTPRGAQDTPAAGRTVAMSDRAYKKRAEALQAVRGRRSAAAPTAAGTRPQLRWSPSWPDRSLAWPGRRQRAARRPRRAAPSGAQLIQARDHCVADRRIVGQVDALQAQDQVHANAMQIAGDLAAALGSRQLQRSSMSAVALCGARQRSLMRRARIALCASLIRRITPSRQIAWSSLIKGLRAGRRRCGQTREGTICRVATAVRRDLPGVQRSPVAIAADPRMARSRAISADRDG
jgi:hypothetical protein